MVTDELLAWVRQAALPEYEIDGELGRDRRARPVFLAREQPGARPLLLALEPAGRTPDGEEQFTLVPVLRLESVAAAVACGSCGYVDPRGGRYCPACGAPIADAIRDTARRHAEFVTALAEQVPEYELLAEHAAGEEDRLYFARHRTSGALETLHVVHDATQPEDEAYQLEVTGSAETLESGVLGPLAALSPTGGSGRADRSASGKTLAFSAATLAALVPSSEPAEDTSLDAAMSGSGIRPAAVAPQFGLRERAARRGRSRRWMAVGVVAAALLGGGAALAARMHGAAGARSPAPDSSVTAAASKDTLRASAGSASVLASSTPAETGRGTKVGAAAESVAPARSTPAARADTAGAGLARQTGIGGASTTVAAPKPAAAKRPLCDRPGRGYNANDECYDEAPDLVSGDTDVVLPGDFVGTPLSSTMWLKVSKTGEVVAVEQDEPSTPEFEQLARQNATALEFTAAQKNGRSVSAWVRLRFKPVSGGQ